MRQSWLTVPMTPIPTNSSQSSPCGGRQSIGAKAENTTVPASAV
jgi:hypothetical protein